jgi:SAM-dependent methyltransferase
MDTQSEVRMQRVDEWVKLDEIQIKYHEAQWQSPKQSTKALEAFAAYKLQKAQKILDLGCGAGAATAYFAERYPATQFVGKDYVPELLETAKLLASQRPIDNLEFEQADWFNLKKCQEFDGVISLQTLSWLPEFQKPLSEIFLKLKPEWIALNSLFYDGDISCKIEVNEHTRGAQSFYNVYSLREVERFCLEYGYCLTRWTPFEIDIDIPRPADVDNMGTYTSQVVQEDGHQIRRLQISGPLLLSWYMILIERVA